ncbi:MAG: tetratricopeptide repeat protein [Bdellovibrionales bacterium]|nr:tetratricopeptide repeat protein [Bdellovibrionales bacterium]
MASLLWLPAILYLAAAPVAAKERKADSSAATARGPAPVSEVAILWKDAREAFGVGAYAEAADKLARLVDRHPGFGHDVEARGLLGESLLRLARFEDAVKPLRAYLDAQPRGSAETPRARLTLIRAYVGAGKFSEALLLVRETLDALQPRNASPEISTEALVLQAKANLGLKRDIRAERSLSSARRDWERLTPEARAVRSDLAGELGWTGLEIRLRRCRGEDPAAPGKKPTEAEVLAAHDRWGLCLKEAALDFRATLETDSEVWGEEATESLAQGFRFFGLSCSNPPLPAGKKLSPEQALRYREELSGELRRRCGLKVEETRGLLTAWKKDAPPARLEQLNELLGKLKDGYGDTD